MLVSTAVIAAGAAAAVGVCAPTLSVAPADACAVAAAPGCDGIGDTVSSSGCSSSAVTRLSSVSSPDSLTCRLDAVAAGAAVSFFDSRLRCAAPSRERSCWCRAWAALGTEPEGESDSAELFGDCTESCEDVDAAESAPSVAADEAEEVRRFADDFSGATVCSAISCSTVSSTE